MHLIHAAVLIAGFTVAEQSPAPRSSSFDHLRSVVARSSSTVKPELVAQIRAQADAIADDCKGAEHPTMPTEGQRIYGRLYTWTYTAEGSKRCLHLLDPEYRLLSRDEAYDLMLASIMIFPPSSDMPGDNMPVIMFP